MHQVTNPFQACSEILLKPNAVFAALDKQQNWSWVPFFLVTIMAVLPSYFYFNFVDFDWYKELIVNSQYANVSPAEQDAFRQSMGKSQVLTFTLVGGSLGLVIVNAIMAAYLNMMTKSDEQNLNGFSDWYGFSWWISLPVVLSGLIAMLVILFANDPQLAPTSLAPTSLAFILGLDMKSSWFNLLQTIRLESFWSMYLITVGISQWTRVGANKAYLIATLPYGFIWGFWAISLIL